MQSKRIIQNILFALAGGLGLFQAYLLQCPKDPEIRHQIIAQLNTPTHILMSPEVLLSVRGIEQLRVQGQKLIINQDTLTFKKDIIQGISYDLPQNQAQWKTYLNTKLGNGDDSDFEMVLSKIKGAFVAEWRNLSKQKVWNRLSDVQKSCHILVNSIETNQDETFYISKNELNRLPKSDIKVSNNTLLELTSPQIHKPKTLLNWKDWVLPGALILIGILGLIVNNKKANEDTIPENTSADEVTEEAERPDRIPEENESRVIEEPTDQVGLLIQYFQNFQERYGNFYTDIELLPEFPTDELTKQKIKGQLIEMGLHAFSLSRAFLFDYLDRPEKEPNILLIQNKQSVTDLDPSLYKALTFSAYETNKRYRFLARIFIEMNIGKLDGALLYDTFFSKELLTHPD